MSYNKENLDRLVSKTPSNWIKESEYREANREKLFTEQIAQLKILREKRNKTKQ